VKQFYNGPKNNSENEENYKNKSENPRSYKDEVPQVAKQGNNKWKVVEDDFGPNTANFSATNKYNF
jgi:hypothetical protein